MRIIENKIQFKEFLPIYGVNCLVGNITPFKSGETITPFLFRRYLKIPAGQGFSIVILDRFLELLIFVMIFIFIVAYAIANQLITGLPLDIFKFIFIVLLLIISILLTVIFSPRITFGILNKLGFLKKYSLTKKFIDFIERELKIFYDGLSLFKNKNVYNFLIPMTLTSWLLEFLSFYLILKSILPVSFLQTVAAQTISIAAALVTFIPAGIGIGDLGTVFILYLFGYPTVLATAGMVLDRLFLTSTQLIFGMISSLFLKEKVE